MRTSLTRELDGLKLKLDHIHRIVKEIYHKMATQADLDSAVDRVQSSVEELGKDLARAIADLKAKIAAGVDPTSAISRLDSINARVAEFDASAEAESPEPSDNGGTGNETPVEPTSGA